MIGEPLRLRLTESVREIVFGLEDSLVSTLGTVTGVAVGTGDAYIVLLTGIVLVFVEALSMSAGSYLSSKSAAELYEERRRQDTARVLSERISDNEALHELFERKGFSKAEISVAMEAIGRERRLWLKEVKRSEYRLIPAQATSPEFAGIVMGVFYLLGGFFVLVPYLSLPISVAMPVTVIMSVIALYFVGVAKAKLTNVPVIKSGVEMLTVSLGAALLGFFIGHAISLAAGVEPLY